MTRTPSDPPTEFLNCRHRARTASPLPQQNNRNLSFVPDALSRRCPAPRIATLNMASTLRRRGPPAHKEEEESTSEPPASREESPAKDGEKVKVVHHRSKKQGQRKRKTTAIFLLGSLFGLVAAGFFAKSNDLISFPEISDLSMSMDSLFDVLPASLVKDMRDLVVSEKPRAGPYWCLSSCRLIAFRA